MADGLDWPMRPVLRGLCRYESLIDGTLDIVDLAIMHEALDVQDENRARFEEATKR